MNWQVGQTYGKYKFVSATTTEATFELPDGSIETYPNIFQEKTPAQMEALKSKEPNEPRKPRKPSKVDVEAASEDDLVAAAAAIKAKLAKLKKVKA